MKFLLMFLQYADNLYLYIPTYLMIDQLVPCQSPPNTGSHRQNSIFLDLKIGSCWGTPWNGFNFDVCWNDVLHFKHLFWKRWKESWQNSHKTTKKPDEEGDWAIFILKKHSAKHSKICKSTVNLVAYLKTFYLNGWILGCQTFSDTDPLGFWRSSNTWSRRVDTVMVATYCLGLLYHSPKQ